MSGYDYELISIDQTDNFYSLYIEHLGTRRRALIVVHSSAPITRTDWKEPTMYTIADLKECLDQYDDSGTSGRIRLAGNAVVGPQVGLMLQRGRTSIGGRELR